MYIVFAKHFIKVEPRESMRLLSNDPLQVLQTVRTVVVEEEVETVIVYELALGIVYSLRDSYGTGTEPCKRIAMTAWQSEEGGPITEKFYDTALELQTAASSH